MFAKIGNIKIHVLRDKTITRKDSLYLRHYPF